MARVLITGVAGFIGSHLARGLLNEGATVRGLDNLSSGYLANIASVHDKIEFCEGDVQDTGALRAACRGVEYVFHQAAIPSVAQSLTDPLGTDGPNLGGTLKLLEAARQAGVKRLMFAASSAVYGNNPELPKREDMLPEPISPYAVQKLASELYMSSYAQVFGLETVALRYFNIFGPRQDPSSHYSGVLARFMSQMARNETPTIFGDGETSRDFTHVDNVVQANLLAARAPSSVVSGRVYNIATGSGVTLNHAYNLIRSLSGFEGGVRYMAEREGDVRHSVADISRAKRDLGYEVVCSFEDGLRHILAPSRRKDQVYCGSRL